MTWLSTCSDEAPVWPMAILLRQASCRAHTEESDAEKETKEVQHTNTMARGLRWITNASVRERPSTPKIISPTYPTSLAKKNSHLTGLRNQLLATFSTLFPNVADSSNV